MKYKSRTPIYREGVTDITLEELVLYPTIVAIATHEDSAQEINLLFNRYKHMKKVELFGLIDDEPNLVFFESYPIYERVLMLKLYTVIQIVEEFESEEKAYEIIERLIIKGHKRIYDYYHRNKKLNLVHLVDFINARYDSDLEGLQPLLISMYFFLQCSDTGFNAYFDEVLKQYYVYNLKSAFSQTYLVRSEKLTKEQEIHALETFKKLTGIRLKKEIWLSEVFSGMEEEAMKNLTKAEALEIRKTVQRTGSLNPIYKQPFVRNVKTIFGCLPFYNLNDIHFVNSIKYTRKHLFNSYYLYLHNLKKNRYDESEQENMLYQVIAESMFSATLFTKYERLNDEYITLFKEVENIDTEKIAFDLKEKERVLQLENKKMKSEQTKLEIRNKELEDYIHKLEIQMKEKVSEENELIALKKEVVQLREVVFSSDDELVEDTEVTTFTEAERASLETLNVAVIGGHKNYANRLKEHIEHLRHVEPEEKNTDLSFIKQMDIVLFHTSYNNHVLYERFKKEWDKDQMKVLFVSKTSNIEKIVKEILATV